MRNELEDIVTHTCSLGFIDLVKITSDQEETTLIGLADDRSVVIQAKFNDVIGGFNGTFGMPNISKLKVLLSIPEYGDNAKIQLSTKEANGETVPVGLHFENQNGDFKNDYRFMPFEIVNEKLRNVKFKGTTWNVEFTPSQENIQRLKYQAMANSEELTFMVKTDGNDLKLYFGDHSTHAGDFVFESGVSGQLTRAWHYPISQVVAILNLNGKIEMKFSDAGAAMITSVSPCATYEYILPAFQK